MPFDPHRLADRVIVLPPTPPGRDGGEPRRLHIHIELVLRAPPSPVRPKPRRIFGGGLRVFDVLAVALLGFVLFHLLHH